MGGMAPYIYDWANGSQLNPLISLVPDTYTVLVTDARGCTYTAAFDVDFTVGTAEAELGPRLQVWPTQSGGQFQLKAEHCSNGWYEVLNALGQPILAASSIQPLQTIDLSSVPVGNYFIQVHELNFARKTLKIIKI